PAASSGFTDQLEPTTGNGGAVSYVTTSVNAHLSVSSSGAISVVGGPLNVASYTVSGTDSDPDGDTGTWTYTLTVSAGTITQGAPTSATTTPAASSGFTDQLE